jgi:hypothetical protein
MKKLAILLLPSVLVASVFQAQQKQPPPPTLDQCRSYYYLWQPPQSFGGVNDVVGLFMRDVKLTDDELAIRSGFMGQCGMVALDFKSKPGYNSKTPESIAFDVLSVEYMAVQGMRYDAFIRRHKLSQEFKDEDLEQARKEK